MPAVITAERDDYNPEPLARRVAPTKTNYAPHRPPSRTALPHNRSYIRPAEGANRHLAGRGGGVRVAAGRGGGAGHTEEGRERRRCRGGNSACDGRDVARSREHRWRRVHDGC